jgi:hypothetical protein
MQQIFTGEKESGLDVALIDHASEIGAVLVLETERDCTRAIAYANEMQIPLLRPTTYSMYLEHLSQSRRLKTVLISNIDRFLQVALGESLVGYSRDISKDVVKDITRDYLPGKLYSTTIKD